MSKVEILHPSIISLNMNVKHTTMTTCDKPTWLFVLLRCYGKSTLSSLQLGSDTQGENYPDAANFY